MTLTGREKATIFLSILGAQASSRILRYLPDELADLIAAGINHLPTPSPEALQEVLSEFKSFLALPAGEAATALRIEEKPKTHSHRKTYSFLMYERPQMIAFLLSLLPEGQRDEVLFSLPKEKTVIEELLQKITPNLLSEKLSAELKRKFAERLFN